MSFSGPTRCVFELSYCCNLTCQTCNIWRKEFQAQRNISKRIGLAELLEVQSRLSRFGVRQISYVGGEPFLNRNIFHLIRNAGQLNISTAVITNGSVLDLSSLTHIFDAELDTVIFSMDGPEEIHDSVRGKKGIFEKISHHIKWIQEEKKKRKAKNPKVKIYTTLSKRNFDQVQAVLNIAQKLDVNALRFQLVSIVGPCEIADTNLIFQRDVVGFHSYAVDSRLSLTKSDVDQIKKQLKNSDAWTKKVGIKIHVEDVLVKPGADFNCEFIENSFVLNPYGDVLPCPMLTKYTVGNIFREDLNTIWGNKKHVKLRGILRQDSLPICSQCCVEKWVPR